jgi:hypothetical protein
MTNSTTYAAPATFFRKSEPAAGSYDRPAAETGVGVARREAAAVEARATSREREGWEEVVVGAVVAASTA